MKNSPEKISKQQSSFKNKSQPRLRLITNPISYQILRKNKYATCKFIIQLSVNLRDSIKRILTCSYDASLTNRTFIVGRELGSGNNKVYLYRTIEKCYALKVFVQLTFDPLLDPEQEFNRLQLLKYSPYVNQAIQFYKNANVFCGSEEIYHGVTCILTDLGACDLFTVVKNNGAF